MPAAVLVVEAVIGIVGEDVGCAGGCGVAGFVFETQQAIGERKIEPLLSTRVGVEGEVVGIAQVLEVGDGTGERVALRIQPSRM
jgi:hypothetical protein